MEDEFERCIKIANENYDGHLTLCKFTTNWRFCFGTPNDLYGTDSQYFYRGRTPEEAMEKALQNPKCVEV